MTEETLFHQALAKPAEERAAFLLEACAGDLALKARVEALLQAHEQPASYLKQPLAHLAPTVEPGETAGKAEAPRPSESPGDRIGPYKLLVRPQA